MQQGQFLAGLARYLAPEQLAKLASVSVGIAGAGGLGSNCAMLLARSGIRRMVIVDHDRVEPSNLNRQFYFPQDVRAAKVEALGRNLRLIDPGIKLLLVNKRISPRNIAELFSGCAIVVEALDQAGHKAVLCNTLMSMPCFIVSASGIGGIGGVMIRRKIGSKMVCVGDFSAEVNGSNPPLGPRVMQAAAMQADAVLEYLLK